MLNAKCQVRSKFRHFGEVEIPYLHRRHHHIESFFSAGAHRRAHLLDIRKHLNQALVEAEIPAARRRLFRFRPEMYRRESCQSESSRKDQPRGCTTAVSPESRARLMRSSGQPSSDRAAARRQYSWRFSHFVGDRKAMPGGLDWSNFVRMLGFLHLLRAAARINQALHDSIFDQLQPLTANPFAIKWRARLQRMSHVVPESKCSRRTTAYRCDCSRNDR